MPRTLYIFVLRQHRVSSLTSRMYSVHPVRRFLLESARLVRASETRSHLVTSLSVQESLSRWSLSSSASQEHRQSGLSTGESSATNGFLALALTRRICVFVIMIQRSFHSTAIIQQILSMHSHSQTGVSFGESLQEPTTTLHVTRRHLVSLWTTLMTRPMRSTSLMLLSHHLVQTV